ncbi:hypothetical protein HPMBJEAJ_00024 [Aeromonas phage avDM6]|nr:hypothetical protein HPMBJEAJ_00024 [Aeromonas phage avDM6]
MKRVKIIDGREFVESGFPDADVVEMNASIVKWFYENKENEIFVVKDPNQTNPQGYMFYIELYQDGVKMYKFSPIAVYDWELEKFFMVL